MLLDVTEVTDVTPLERLGTLQVSTSAVSTFSDCPTTLATITELGEQVKGLLVTTARRRAGVRALAHALLSGQATSVSSGNKAFCNMSLECPTMVSENWVGHTLSGQNWRDHRRPMLHRRRAAGRETTSEFLL
jgi:hypothetical protein